MPDRALNIQPYDPVGAYGGGDPYSATIRGAGSLDGSAYGEVTFTTVALPGGFLNFRVSGTNAITRTFNTINTSASFSYNNVFFGEVILAGAGQTTDVMCKISDFSTDDTWNPSTHQGYNGSFWGVTGTWAPLNTQASGMGITCSGQNFVGNTTGVLHFCLAGTENIPELHYKIAVSLSLTA